MAGCGIAARAGNRPDDGAVVSARHDRAGTGEAYWFAQKRFGYGAVPVTWQGWMTTLAYLALIAAIALKAPGTLLKAGLMLPLTAAYIYFLWTRTDGGFRWRWGRGKD